MDEDTLTDIEKAHEHFKDIDDTEKELINHYKAEMDPDDWEDNPLKISYSVINWLLKKKSAKFVSYEPDLIQSGVMTNQQFIDQVKNAELLSNILGSFPQIENENGIFVYRGKTCGNIRELTPGSSITMYNFLSTSTYEQVATRFAARENPCVMRIHIPKNTPLPYISETTDPQTSETEVLLPPGSTFTLIKKEGGVYDFELTHFGPIETRYFWSHYKKLATEIYDKKYKSSRTTKRRKVTSGGKRKRTKKYKKH